MKYKVTVLTPLLAGDGNQLSPVDYMVWKDQVNVLDQARIFRLLARGPRLEGYLAQLRKATKLDFASWGGFAQNFSGRRIPFENASSTAVWNAASTENLFIPTFASGHRGAYLPGSAIKGALRTGLVFSRWNATTIDRLSAAVEGERHPRRLVEAAENAAGASQVKVLAAGDSAPVPANSFKVYLTRVASLDTRNKQVAWKIAGRGSVPDSRIADSTPLFAEMAVPGTVFAGDWQERKFFENPEFTRALGWRSVPNVKSLTEAANDYAAAQLRAHIQFAGFAGLSPLAETLVRLGTELDQARNGETTCVLCLGWGGGFVSKSAFAETDLPSYRKLLKSVPPIGRSMRDATPFPKTRRIVFSGNRPALLPGWVKVEFAQ